MKREYAILVLICCMSWPALADDWATTGKGGSGGNLTAAQVEAAWIGMAKYEAGQDEKALLAMNWVVINAQNDPNQRAATAARLAKILERPGNDRRGSAVHLRRVVPDWYRGRSVCRGTAAFRSDDDRHGEALSGKSQITRLRCRVACSFG